MAQKKIVQTQTERHVEGADTVVLMIHGIIEGPAQFDPLIPIINKTGCSAVSILLPGHGKTGREFSKNGRKQWTAYVSQQVESLRRRYHNIILAGHSMGCLLAAKSCLDNPSGIRGLFCIAMPLHIRLTARGMINAARVALNRVKENDPISTAARDAYSISETPLYGYAAWLPRYLDLFHLCRTVRSRLHEIRVPVFLVHSEEDEFVSKRSLSSAQKALGDNLTEMLVLKHSGHFYYPEEDRKLLTQALLRLLESIRTEKC